MSYLKIPNLYRNQDVMMTGPKVYALEKIHGTSAHVKLTQTNPGVWEVNLYSGGEKHVDFSAVIEKCFKPTKLPDLVKIFKAEKEIVIYGEAYGGNQQRMTKTFGPEKRFVAFDVTVDGKWLDVPSAENVATELGLDFVPWELVDNNYASLDAHRDMKSRQAAKVFKETDGKCEGIVIRPVTEQNDKYGERLIAKHKQNWARETVHIEKPNPTTEEIQKAMEERQKAANYITEMRLAHVLSKMKAEGTDIHDMKNTRNVIDAIMKDVVKEEGDKIQLTEAMTKSLSKEAASLYVRWCKNPASFRHGAD